MDFKLGKPVSIPVTSGRTAAPNPLADVVNQLHATGVPSPAAFTVTVKPESAGDAVKLLKRAASKLDRVTLSAKVDGGTVTFWLTATKVRGPRAPKVDPAPTA